MNIFEFINSKDVRKHLEKMDYQFTTPEAAYIVYQSKKKTLAQKFAMWEEIIKTMPDCSMAKRPNMKEIPSIHEYLRKYITFQQQQIIEFKSNETAYIYRFFIYYHNKNIEDSIGNCVFLCYEKCVEAIKRCIDELKTAGYELENVKFAIQKRKANVDYEDYTELHINCSFDEISVEKHNAIQNTDFENTFNGMWFNFPTPFVRGEIVFDCTSAEQKPFVLELLRTWNAETLIKNNFRATGPYVQKADTNLEIYKNSGDSSDMQAFGYEYYKECGLNYKDGHATCYLDLEYYRGELKGELRLLKPFAAYVRRECGKQLAFNSYSLILKELELENQRKAFKDLYGRCSKLDLGI